MQRCLWAMPGTVPYACTLGNPWAKAQLQLPWHIPGRASCQRAAAHTLHSVQLGNRTHWSKEHREATSNIFGKQKRFYPSTLTPIYNAFTVVYIHVENCLSKQNYLTFVTLFITKCIAVRSRNKLMLKVYLFNIKILIEHMWIPNIWAWSEAPNVSHLDAWLRWCNSTSRVITNPVQLCARVIKHRETTPHTTFSQRHHLHSNIYIPAEQPEYHVLVTAVYGMSPSPKSHSNELFQSF